MTQTPRISGQDPMTRLRYFSHNADGGILTRRDGTLDSGAFTGTADSRQHYAYANANGQQVAALGENGTIIDAATPADRVRQQRSGYDPGANARRRHPAAIAQRVYGMWSVLAAANAVTDLVAGTTLQAPEVKRWASAVPGPPRGVWGPGRGSGSTVFAPQHCRPGDR